jgi:hypothetical protein
VTRQTDTLLKYFLDITNVTSEPVTVEARYTVHGWNRWAA